MKVVLPQPLRRQILHLTRLRQPPPKLPPPLKAVVRRHLTRQPPVKQLCRAPLCPVVRRQKQVVRTPQPVVLVKKPKVKKPVKRPLLQPQLQLPRRQKWVRIAPLLPLRRRKLLRPLVPPQIRKLARLRRLQANTNKPPQLLLKKAKLLHQQRRPLRLPKARRNQLVTLLKKQLLRRLVVKLLRVPKQQPLRVRNLLKRKERLKKVVKQLDAGWRHLLLPHLRLLKLVPLQKPLRKKVYNKPVPQRRHKLLLLRRTLRSLHPVLKPVMPPEPKPTMPQHVMQVHERKKDSPAFAPKTARLRQTFPQKSAGQFNKREILHNRLPPQHKQLPHRLDRVRSQQVRPLLYVHKKASPYPPPEVTPKRAVPLPAPPLRQRPHPQHPP